METEKLRPSLSWGDALLFINKQDEKIKELQDEIERLKGKPRRVGRRGFR